MAAAIKSSAEPASSAGEFQLRPWGEARERWRSLCSASSTAGIYHGERWLQVLAYTYRTPLYVATVEQGDEVRAGCLLGETRTLFAKHLTALPYSDSCEPLATDQSSLDALLSGLTANPQTARGCELRGITGPPPWETVNCFARWTLNLDHPADAIHQATSSNFRRNARRALRENVRIEHGGGSDLMRRYYAMHLETRRRLGVPPQPFRFFEAVHSAYSADGAIDIWIAREDGRDAAGAVLLVHGDNLYYKWGARAAQTRDGTNHLLFWNILGELAGRAAVLDLGRTDVRNDGLSRFKKELGGVQVPLPYSFYPHAPSEVSAEVMTGTRKIVSGLWRYLPLSATKVVGGALYGLLR